MRYQIVGQMCRQSPEAGDVPRVVVRGDGADEALRGVDVIHPDHGVSAARHCGEHFQLLANFNSKKSLEICSF